MWLLTGGQPRRTAATLELIAFQSLFMRNDNGLVLVVTAPSSLAVLFPHNELIIAYDRGIVTVNGQAGQRMLYIERRLLRVRHARLPHTHRG